MLAIPAQAQSQVKIRRDESAKFDGVLVEEKSYEKMWTDIQEKYYLKSELQSCLDREIPTQPSEVFNPFLSGLFVGMLATALLISTVK